MATPPGAQQHRRGGDYRRAEAPIVPRVQRSRKAVSTQTSVESQTRGGRAGQVVAALAPLAGGIIAGPTGAAVATAAVRLCNITPPATPTPQPTLEPIQEEEVQPSLRRIAGTMDGEKVLGYRPAPLGVTSTYKALLNRQREWTAEDYFLSIVTDTWAQVATAGFTLYIIGEVVLGGPLMQTGLITQAALPVLLALVFMAVGHCWIAARRWGAAHNSAEGELREEGVTVMAMPFSPPPTWVQEQRVAQALPSELLGHLQLCAAFTARDVKVAQELKLKAKAWCDKTQMSEAEKAALVPRAVAAAMVPSQDELAAHAYMGGRVANKGIWAANAFIKSGTLAGGEQVPLH